MVISTLILLLIVGVLAYLAYRFLPNPFNVIAVGIILILGVIRLLA